MNEASTSGPPTVVVVGGGLGGTATSIRLLRDASAPVKVQLWERRAEFRNAGPAYHRDGNPWEHIFNIQAGRMSLFREDTTDFIEWANTEADRSEWPAQWRRETFYEHSAAPRRLFHDYLETRLAEAVEQASTGVLFEPIDAEAIDLDQDGPRIRVQGLNLTESPATFSKVASCVVLATGLELRDPPYADRVRGHSGFVREPYSKEGREALELLSSDGTVVIVGSVLSAYDTVNYLIARGHEGDIFMVSGSGSSLRSYPEDHLHDVVSLPAPTFEAVDLVSVDTIVNAVKREWTQANALAHRLYPSLHPAVLSERVAKAWEPHIPEVLSRIDDQDLRHLLNEYGTEIATLRVGAMAGLVEGVHAALAESGHVHRVMGVVESILPSPERGVEVVVNTGPQEQRIIRCELVVDSFGRQPDYTRSRSMLWRNLLQKGLVVPHQRTGRGLEVDASGRALAGRGTPSPIWLVGGLREGDEIVRNGRAGAFSLNLAAIKNHSLSVAMNVVNELEFPTAINSDRRGEVWSKMMSTAQGASLTAEAVQLEVRRLASRSRRRRSGFATDLANCVQRIQGAISLEDPGDPDFRRVIYLNVREEAVRAMCDVTVTPKRLRELLSLTTDDDSAVNG